jgi:ADP-ribose pyrophosphatase YjhB (NUDIX family)
MLTFSRDNRRFTVRVVAIILRGDGDEVLLNKALESDFWVLPGGRAELLEPLSDGIKREMREELGADAEIERLAFVAEIFFESAGVHNHSLEFYFLMRLPVNCPVNVEMSEFTTYTDEGGLPLVFKWFRTDDLPRVLPLFLKEKLASISPQTEYLVNYEESQALADDPADL